MEVVNLFEVEVARDDDDPARYDTGYVRLAEKLGSTKLGGTVYELPTGQSICPYHYEYGSEEWLIVLTGRPTLRVPEGERELGPGETVCSPRGPGRAQGHESRSGGRARVDALDQAEPRDRGVSR